MAKRAARKASSPLAAKPKSGRPRVRRGDDVQVTVEFSSLDYARLCGFVAQGKGAARRACNPVSASSQKHALLGAWRAFWRALPSQQRQAVLHDAAFQAVISRRRR